MTFPKSIKFLALLPLALALTQCDQVGAVLKPKPKGPGPYAFDLTLKMSPRGEAALGKKPNSISVRASYYGLAKPGYRGKVDRLNRIYLGDESWTLVGNARRVHLLGEPIDTSLLPQTTDGQPYALVNISGAIGHPDDYDTLKCRSFIGPIRTAQEQPQELTCEYETERYWAGVAASSAQSAQ